MTNAEMIPNRYKRWADARTLVAKIRATLLADGVVIVGTCTKVTQYTRKHAQMFKATRNGAYVQRGKLWDCIDGCAFRFGRMVAP